MTMHIKTKSGTLPWLLRVGMGILSILSIQCQDQSPSFSDLVPENAQTRMISEKIECIFLEGPAWDGKNTLYFSDIPNNLIYQYQEPDSFRIFVSNSAAANGLMFDRQGRLVVCQGGSGQVVALDQSGQVTETLAAGFRERPFNSPNDLVIDSKGGIYFTDPRFGDSANMPQDKEAVYYRNPAGEIIRVIDTLSKPNGIILSPDEQTLYVADTFSKYITAYKISATGLPTDRYLFAELSVPADAENDRSGADGMTIDVLGNLYVTTRLGVQILSKSGKLIGIIQVSETPSNCTFGGPELKTLFITARKHLYAIDLKVAGLQFPLLK